FPHVAWTARMAQATSLSSPSADAALPLVRLEVRVGNARPATYEVGDGGFLIGSVPGCDLRVPGANLAPVLCLIGRHAGGANLRKLAPVQPIVVNGKSVTSAHLVDGDRVSLGEVNLVVSVAPGTDVPQSAAGAGHEELKARERKLLEIGEKMK